MASYARATHEHRLAESATWPWLPAGDTGATVAHPYCVDCGSIKSVGTERALDMGGLMNLLGRLRVVLEARGHRVTQVQRRLIGQRLTALEADDKFAQSRSRQYDLVAGCVSAVVGIPEHVVHSYLHHC